MSLTAHRSLFIQTDSSVELSEYNVFIVLQGGEHIVHKCEQVSHGYMPSSSWGNKKHQIRRNINGEQSGRRKVVSFPTYKKPSVTIKNNDALLK